MSKQAKFYIWKNIWTTLWKVGYYDSKGICSIEAPPNKVFNARAFNSPNAAKYAIREYKKYRKVYANVLVEVEQAKLPEE